jgi:two-component system, response regulator PdtaR
MNADQLRIIVAEDESIIALDIKRKLEGFGHRVLCTVASGEAVIAKSHELHPDLLVMDIGLQGMTSGLTAITSIRGSMKMPVVFVTAYSDDATRRQIAEVQSAGYVSKPVGASELRSGVEYALKGL